ncbi:MAG: coenzyme F420-0:L-glutamate ligase [Bdellovibrionales bacterium]|nr:coenzyme F420-0:L-glutamate ligase [Bdellovibrionales bacterium]
MNKSLSILAAPISTPIFKAGRSIADFVWTHAGKRIRPKSILAITSKLFSIAEGRVVARASVNKRELIDREADQVVCETLHGVVLAVKHGMLFPTAGIDESNSEDGSYLLLPKEPFGSLKTLHESLASKLGFKDFGLIMTDSRTQPLRRGVTGLALSHYGFVPVRDCRGQTDLFGRSFKVTEINNADPIAAVAVLLMGETNESTPLAVVDAPFLEYRLEGKAADIQIPIEEDLYGSQLGGKGNR